MKLVDYINPDYAYGTVMDNAEWRIAVHPASLLDAAVILEFLSLNQKYSVPKEEEKVEIAVELKELFELHQAYFQADRQGRTEEAEKLLQEYRKSTAELAPKYRELRNRLEKAYCS